MKTRLLTRTLDSLNYQQALEICHSANTMARHIQIQFGDERVWSETIEVSLNRNYVGGWDLLVWMDSSEIPEEFLKGKTSVRLSMETAPEGFHLPHWRLKIKVKPSKKDHTTLIID